LQFRTRNFANEAGLQWPAPGKKEISVNRTDFQQLADVRIDEGAALLALPVPRSDGAYYLAGYAVECALKACIARTYNQHDWPDKEFRQ
jgi:hypothetical protein